MVPTDWCDVLQDLCSRIQESIAPYAGRIEYGNLRSHVSRYECGDGDPITNIALVYETPGGSTDQINISYHHSLGIFSLIDVDAGEVTVDTPEEVIELIRPRVAGIPDKRKETLRSEIRRQVDGGTNHGGLCGALNRMMQTELRGGGITLDEMKDAMTFAVLYMKRRHAEPQSGSEQPA
jgi:hypothetical protein